VQSLGCTEEEAHKLVSYVYSRDIGEPFQEVGGVMNTLAGLCNANDLRIDENAEKELARVNQPEISEKIRLKQLAKPKFGPLPGSNKCVNEDPLMISFDDLAAGRY
jgi:hypothetical protein